MDRFPKKPCKYCGISNHFPYQCFHRPKPNNKIAITGKYGKQWIKTRETWFKKNLPNNNGFYICYICGKWLYKNQTTLDHVKSRSHHPELRFVLSNLKPCCWACNQEKGSSDYEL